MEMTLKLTSCSRVTGGYVTATLTVEHGKIQSFSLETDWCKDGLDWAGIDNVLNWLTPTMEVLSKASIDP